MTHSDLRYEISKLIDQESFDRSFLKRTLLRTFASYRSHAVHLICLLNSEEIRRKPRECEIFVMSSKTGGIAVFLLSVELLLSYRK